MPDHSNFIVLNQYIIWLLLKIILFQLFLILFFVVKAGLDLNFELWFDYLQLVDYDQ